MSQKKKQVASRTFYELSTVSGSNPRMEEIPIIRLDLTYKGTMNALNGNKKLYRI
jgi:hypothetical protein